MKAVIIAHPQDIKFFNKNDNKINFYAYNYYTYLKLKKKIPRIYYLNDKLDLKNLDNFSQNICLNWFKRNRIKNYNLNKISLGNIIHPRLINEYSNSIKNFILIKKILLNNTKLFFPQNNKKYIQHILDFFPNKINFYKSNNNLQFLLATNNLRSDISSLPIIHKLSNIARFIQYFFFSKKKNKIIYYPDPRTNNFFKNFNNILSLNSLFVWKSFYFKLNREHIKKVKKIIDFNYQEDLNIFINFNIKKNNKKFLLIFIRCINNLVKSKQKNILRTLAIYNELFEYYKPKAIIFPGVLNFDYAIGLELAKINKIKTAIAIDGVLTNYNPGEFNKNYFFDKIIAWGNENKILLENHNIKKKDIILSDSYLKKNNPKSTDSENYVIVLPLHHYSSKVSAHSDKCFYHTINILKVLNHLGEKKIILKLKKGNYDIDQDEEIYKNFIKKNNLKNIIIKKGDLQNLLKDAKYVIGQCSTSIYEATINDVPYHIYEPHDLGLSANDIKKSNLLNFLAVSRNKNQLLINLKKKNKSSLSKSKKQIFKGKRLKKIF